MKYEELLLLVLSDNSVARDNQLNNIKRKIICGQICEYFGSIELVAVNTRSS